MPAYALLLRRKAVQALIAALVITLASTAPLHAQSACGSSLIEADQLLKKGLFDQLEVRLEPCLRQDDASREEKVEAYRMLILASMATDRYLRANRFAEELLSLKPDYEASFRDSPKFTKLLHQIRVSWLDPTRQAVVTATKKEQKIGEAPAIISLVTARQIEQYGYADVGEALGNISGLDLLDDHLQYNLGVRGINAGMRGWSRLVKVMIENQSVSFRPSSENFLGGELIPLQAVDRIEVVRGPSSALYGANAYLGVVNIIPRRGERVDGLELTSGIGSVQGNPAYTIGLLYGKKIGRFDYLLAGSGSFSDRSGLAPADLPDRNKYRDQDRESRNDLSRPGSLYARIAYEGRAADRLALDFHLQQLDSFGEFQDWGVLTDQNRISIRNLYIRTRYARPLGERLGSSLSLTYSQGKPTDEEFLTINQKGVGDWITREVGYRALDLATELSYTSEGGNNLTLGFDHSLDLQDLQTYFRHYYDQPAQPTGFEQGDTTFVNTGVYLQSVLYPFRSLPPRILERLGLTAGVRYDRHNIYEDILNYRFAGALPLIGSWYAKLLYGTSFKAPSPVQLYTTLIAPQGVLGNSDLKPEKARTWEAALGGKLTERITLILVGFTTQVRNNVELVPSGANTRADNVARISSHGFEEETFYRSDWTSAYLNLSYQQSTKKRVDLLRGTLTGNTHLYPSYMVKWGFNRRLRRAPVEFGFEGKYWSERIPSEQIIKTYDPINLEKYHLESHFLVDFILTTRALASGRRTGLQFKIQNLLNREHYYPGFRDFDIPGLGRRYFASATYHL